MARNPIFACPPRRLALAILPMLAFVTLPGCNAGSIAGYGGYYAYTKEGGGTDAAVGEQHDVGFPVNDAFVMTQDVLRGEGILFEVKPDDHLVTLWKDADTPATMFGSLLGVHPQYRYEVEVVSLAPRESRIVVNVRVQDVPDSDLPQYQATKRLNLFNKFDQLAATFPPPSGTPAEGGVNYALLPNEDLKGLAKRATGSENNWQQIAKDNGLNSPAQPSGVQSVWIRNTLLDQAGKVDQTKGASSTN
jgi:hypothetical protein